MKIYLQLQLDRLIPESLCFEGLKVTADDTQFEFRPRKRTAVRHR